VNSLVGLFRCVNASVCLTYALSSVVTTHISLCIIGFVVYVDRYWEISEGVTLLFIMWCKMIEIDYP